MDFMSLWGTVNSLSGSGAGGNSSKRQITLTSESDDQKITLPVTPDSYDVQSGQNNKKVDIIEYGEMLLFGNKTLRELKFSSFFPSLKHEYPFVVGDRKEPSEFVELLTKWKEAKKPIRVIITDSPVNMSAAIMNFDYKEQDGSRDVYYTLTLSEYRPFNTPTANNTNGVNEQTGLKERPTEPTADKMKSETARAKDLFEASRKAYGDFQHYRSMATGAGLKNLVTTNIRSLVNGGKIKI